MANGQSSWHISWSENTVSSDLYTVYTIRSCYVWGHFEFVNISFVMSIVSYAMTIQYMVKMSHFGTSVNIAFTVSAHRSCLIDVQKVRIGNDCFCIFPMQVTGVTL